MSAREILASWYEDKAVLVFGHRGASAYAPMNTIPAFELAAEQGADAIELDVHLTKDGELSLFMILRLTTQQTVKVLSQKKL